MFSEDGLQPCTDRKQSIHVTQGTQDVRESIEANGIRTLTKLLATYFATKPSVLNHTVMQVRDTRQNAESSRSHQIVRIFVESRPSMPVLPDGEPSYVTMQ